MSHPLQTSSIDKWIDAPTRRVDAAGAASALVLRALLQIHQMEVAQVHGALAERLVEAYHCRFVFGTDRSNSERSSITQLP